MKNVLVTGGAGFIGSNFVRYLLSEERDVRIVNLDALTYAGSLENLSSLPDPVRHVFVHGDISNGDLVLRLISEYAIDTIVHFAAETHVDRSIAAPRTCVETNINGTFHLLESARYAWLEQRRGAAGKRLHYVSTDEVFGSLMPDDPPCSELAPHAPGSPYAATKSAGEQLVRSYANTYGLP